MRHIFIINPVAGHQNAAQKLTMEIRQEMRGLDFEIHETMYPGHATEIVRDIITSSAPRDCRFYACGGDGTLSEVVQGAIHHPQVEVACVPCGTGNDFVRLFTNRSLFLSIAAQHAGYPIAVDALSVNDRYALNICNAGIDARIAHWVLRYKHFVPFGKGFPYKFSLFVNFFKKINRRYTITVDDETIEGEFALIAAGGGRYYGGGFFAIPESEPDDGLMNMVFIRRVDRLTLLKKIKLYTNGRHSELGDIGMSRSGKRLILRSDSPEPVCYDGEILMTETAVVELVPRAVRFVVPEGCSLIRSRNQAVNL